MGGRRIGQVRQPTLLLLLLPLLLDVLFVDVLLDWLPPALAVAPLVALPPDAAPPLAVPLVAEPLLVAFPPLGDVLVAACVSALAVAGFLVVVRVAAVAFGAGRRGVGRAATSLGSRCAATNGLRGFAKCRLDAGIHRGRHSTGGHRKACADSPAAEPQTAQRRTEIGAADSQTGDCGVEAERA